MWFQVEKWRNSKSNGEIKKLKISLVFTKLIMFNVLYAKENVWNSTRVLQKIRFSENLVKNMQNAQSHGICFFSKIVLNEINFASVLWYLEMWYVNIKKINKNSNNSDFLGVEKLCQNDQLMVLLLSDLFLCDENGIMNVIGVLSS